MFCFVMGLAEIFMVWFQLQEVDKFQDIEEELKLKGYNGIWKVCLEMHMLLFC